MATKMSITRALNELSLLESRISRAISESVFSTHKKASSKNVLNGRKTIEEFSQEAKASLQSVQALIERRKQIKELIVASNAVTKVTVGTKEYTVASAIERKTSIQLDKMLLSKMTTSFANSMTNVERANDKLENEINSMNIAYMSKENSVSETMLKMNQEYREQNETVLVDPLNIQKLIETMKNDIEEFESNVDFALSESNAITQIEVQD